MKILPVFYLELDLNNAVINYNKEFINFFGLDKTWLAHVNTNICNELEQLKIGQTQSAIIFKNHKLNATQGDKMLLILYVTILKQKDSYSIKMVNWLNWLHNLYSANEHSYNFISGLNNDKSNKNHFSQVSALSCFKALYPLLMHIPNKFRNNSQALYEIMDIFIDNKVEKIYTKDYSRNARSRLQTQLRKELSLKDKDLIDVVKNDNLLNISHNGHMYIPNTQVFETMIYCVKNNSFLNHFMSLAINP